MPSPEITFIARDVPDAFRQKGVLRKWLQHVAAQHGTRIDALTFVLMDDPSLLHYNRSYLQHDDLTDVITFPVENNNGVAGDVLISYDRVRENARIYKTTAQGELHRVMVHGLLHLLGHKDGSPAQKKAIRAEEDRWLKHLERSA